MDSDQLEQRARVAATVVREAGALALDYFRRRGDLRIDSKGLQDMVSQADRECEDLIFARLSEAFPADSFLGEEGGLRGTGSAMWVVDPIDGTANFVRGIPHWCVSIGLIEDGRALCGVLYDPVADELFAGVAGGGATLNGAPIGVTGETDLRKARVGIGFSYRTPVAPHPGDIHALLDAGCEYLRLGSGALGLAYTAAGRLDGYFERHINLWDVAGGLIIVAEAGGRLSDFMTPDVVAEGNEILVATPGIYDQLRGLFDA
ncbi:inositol monophosphatase family protein [Bauldia litoralis]|uniref:Inositol-1-monophosphatase n=1 Tax=Bauldia litoralis TaxID=665467 RepID=A0A1G6CBC9_9HYPH|nr:inositol monophosphatase [Bauldia litoralis]SDB30207.1 myo-inositol-1(or 4)-monophosphatase [Bauldia litoralis]